MIRKILSGLRMRRVGLHYGLARRFRHGGLSCTFVLGTLLGGEGERGKYKYLALGCPLFLGGILGCRWELGWLGSFFLSWLLLLVCGTCSINLFGRLVEASRVLVGATLLGSSALGVASVWERRACYTEG